jgi:hypothetical protein
MTQVSARKRREPGPPAELLLGKKLDFPRFALDQTFKNAPKAKSAAAAKMALPFDNSESQEPI